MGGPLTGMSVCCCMLALSAWLSGPHLCEAFTVPSSGLVLSRHESGFARAPWCGRNAAVSLPCRSRSHLMKDGFRTSSWRMAASEDMDGKSSPRTKRVQQILPLYDGRNLIIGDAGWFLESSDGRDELEGDFAVPLEMDDEERGEFTEWLLYRDGDIVTTVTEDQIEIDLDFASTTTLANPIGSALKTGAGGFVLGALSSMVNIFERQEKTGGDPEKGAAAPDEVFKGDQGTAFRMFGNLLGLRPDEEDQTWALWDVNRDRPPADSQKPSTSVAPTSSPTASDAAQPKAGDETPEDANGKLPAVKEDAAWIEARREGTMLLREAAVTMRQGEFDSALGTCQAAIALFQQEVARGVGGPAEELLARAFAEATAAAEANLKQAEARAEALRLAKEAEEWLTIGDLATALILAERSQAALNEVEEYFGRVSTEELTQVLEIKVRVQEKQQLRQEALGDDPERVSTAGSKRAELERRQREKMVKKKKEAARRRREGEDGAADAPSPRQEEERGREAWRPDKDLGSSLDRAARQALKAGTFEEAAVLANRAALSFKAAARKGYKKGAAEAKGSLNLVARAEASLKLQRAKNTSSADGGDVAIERQNSELEALFAVEAFSSLSPSASQASRESEAEAEALAAGEAQLQAAEEEDSRAAEAQAQAAAEEAAAVVRRKAERAQKEAEDKARKAQVAREAAAAEAAKEKAKLAELEARERELEADARAAQKAEEDEERRKLEEAETAEKEAEAAAARAMREEEATRTRAQEDEAKLAAEALARMRARNAAKAAKAAKAAEVAAARRKDEESRARGGPEQARASAQEKESEPSPDRVQGKEAAQDARQRQEEDAQGAGEAGSGASKSPGGRGKQANENGDEASAGSAPATSVPGQMAAPRVSKFSRNVLSTASRGESETGVPAPPRLRSLGGTQLVDGSKTAGGTVKGIRSERFFGRQGSGGEAYVWTL